MKQVGLLLGCCVSVLGLLASCSAPQANYDDGWSDPTNNIEFRIILEEKGRIVGTRSIVPYLEVRNVADGGSSIHVKCGDGYVEFELVGKDGKVIRDGWIQPRSGGHPDPGTLIVPPNSTIRIGMYCSNWGIPANAAGMIATDSGAWVLRANENGKVFLRATISGDRPDESPRDQWCGMIVTPLVIVDWNE